VLKLVPRIDGVLPIESETLIREFAGKYLRGVPLEIELLREIPLTRAGKLRRVIVEKPS
jgi:acyl-coenzyme A synthetase/AMP-(fatty) acid ligase